MPAPAKEGLNSINLSDYAINSNGISQAYYIPNFISVEEEEYLIRQVRELRTYIESRIIFLISVSLSSSLTVWEPKPGRDPMMCRHYVYPFYIRLSIYLYSYLFILSLPHIKNNMIQLCLFMDGLYIMTLILMMMI